MNKNQFKSGLEKSKKLDLFDKNIDAKFTFVVDKIDYDPFIVVDTAIDSLERSLSIFMDHLDTLISSKITTVKKQNIISCYSKIKEQF